MKVLGSLLQQAVLDDTAVHTLNFDFRKFIASQANARTSETGIDPLLNGNVAVWIELNLTTGSDATVLTIAARARGLKPTLTAIGGQGQALVTATNEIQELLTASAFVDGDNYSYPISASWGAAHGLAIDFTYGVGSGAKVLTVDCWLEAE